jgi:DNA-binding LacI/PurR family transcriptional regulator
MQFDSRLMRMDRAPQRRVRLRDLAEVAGVSEPTVSRSLRDDPQISARTRAYVRHIAEQLGYVPNAAAQNLALRRSQTFGLMVPDVTDPVHGQIVSGFEDEATRHGYVLLISNFRYEPSQEYLGLRTLISNQAAGIAIFGGVVDPALVGPRSRGINLVYVGPEHLTSLHQDPYPSTIQADDAAGVWAAVTEALRLGYRKFGFLDGPGVASNVRRRSAAATAVAAAGMDRLRIYKGGPGNDFTGLARKIVQGQRELILCFDDLRALKLLSALNRLGVRVPDDLGIIGFDDIPFASISNPPLSTIAVPYEQMGQLACAMLIQQLSSGVAASPVTIDVELMLRGTTARVAVDHVRQAESPHPAATRTRIK